MKKQTILILAALICCSASGTKKLIAKKNNSSIWNKSALYFSNTDKWIPSEIEENELIYDTKGKLQEKNYNLIKVIFNGKKIQFELLKANKNGKALTKKEFKERQQNIAKQKSDDYFGDELYPLKKPLQNNVTIKSINDNKSKNTITYQYNQRTKDNTWNGKILINKRNKYAEKAILQPLKTTYADKNFKITKSKLDVIYKLHQKKISLVDKIIFSADFTYESFFYDFKGKSITTIKYKKYKKIK